MQTVPQSSAASTHVPATWLMAGPGAAANCSGVDIGIYDPAAGDAGETSGLTGDALPPEPGTKGTAGVPGDNVSGELPGDSPDDDSGVEAGGEDGVAVEDDREGEGDSADGSGDCSGDASALGMGGSGSGELETLSA